MILKCETPDPGHEVGTEFPFSPPLGAGAGMGVGSQVGGSETHSTTQAGLSRGSAGFPGCSWEGLTRLGALGRLVPGHGGPCAPTGDRRPLCCLPGLSPGNDSLICKLPCALVAHFPTSLLLSSFSFELQMCSAHPVGTYPQPGQVSRRWPWTRPRTRASAPDRCPGNRDDADQQRGNDRISTNGAVARDQSGC